MSAIKLVTPLGFPWKTQDPFLFCVHHLDEYPAGNDELGPATSLQGRRLGQDFAPNREGWRMYHGRRVPGFPAHPHYGFETVTIVTTGVVDHSDSLGAAGRFGFGDVQWMTAGKGVQHCEMFPLLNRNTRNPLELFQIWLNLPHDKKKATPYFAMLWNETIPDHFEKDENGKSVSIRVIAGRLSDTQAPDPAPDSWAADPDHEVAIWTINLEAGATWTIPAAGEGVNRSLFYYNGDTIAIENKDYASGQAFELHAGHDVLLRNGKQKSSLLLLQGKPIQEPVVQQGPFVVNSPEEIEQVMTAYRKTQFGGWPWPDFEHVHPRHRERFARYPDGKEETRPL